MFGFGKERQFLKDVEASMSFLLGFDGDQFISAIFKHYPNAKNFITDEMKKGQPPNWIAGELLRFTIADQITRSLSAEQREQLATFLAANPPAEGVPFPFAKVCRNYAIMMLREGELKKLDPDWVKSSVQYVYFAAKGMSENERLSELMVRAFTGPTTSQPKS